MNKTTLRAELLGRRRGLGTDAIDDARRRVRTIVLRELAGRPLRRVAAYIPLRTEPASSQLLDGLFAFGAEVIVPVVLPDNDLDWIGWTGPDTDASSAPRLGVEQVADAHVVLVPALAVARDGTRLGRGGGSYDRALARVPVTTPVVALLFDGELVETLPREPWDRAVTAVVTPSGWTDLN